MKPKTKSDLIFAFDLLRLIGALVLIGGALAGWSYAILIPLAVLVFGGLIISLGPLGRWRVWAK
jgi:hypothetical protein